jgi:hypothetical protein
MLPGLTRPVHIIASSLLSPRAGCGPWPPGLPIVNTATIAAARSPFLHSTRAANSFGPLLSIALVWAGLGELEGPRVK